MREKLTCLICGENTNLYPESFGRWHLNRAHGITMKQYYDKYVKSDIEGVCRCGNKTAFISYGQGYKGSCSKQCAAISKDRIAKIRATKNEKYGSETYNNRQRSIETTLIKYGVKNVSSCDDVKQRKALTMLKNYGVANPMQSSVVKAKAKETLLHRYGIINPSYSESFKQKRADTNKLRYGVSSHTQSMSYRQYKESLGEWVPIEHKSDWELYRMMVWKETGKWKTQLFREWDGLCYYTSEKLVVGTEQYNDAMYATIDHRTSIFDGFRNSIPYEEIGHIDNLCVCSRAVNTLKNTKNETEFRKWLRTLR